MHLDTGQLWAFCSTFRQTLSSAQSISAPTETSWTMMKHLCLYLLSVATFPWLGSSQRTQTISQCWNSLFPRLSFAFHEPYPACDCRELQRQIYAAVSTTCDGLLLRVCLEFCIGCKVRLKLILDNSAAKQVLHRSGVGRIRHLSCRVLWVQQLVHLQNWQCTGKVFQHLLIFLSL